jgi:hypothetical protein
LSRYAVSYNSFYESQINAFISPDFKPFHAAPFSSAPDGYEQAKQDLRMKAADKKRTPDLNPKVLTKRVLIEIALRNLTNSILSD